MNQSRLAALSRSLRGERVLSVYVDGSATDPAIQRAWRLQLEQSLEEIRVWLEDSPADERESFERCVRHLEDALGGFEASVGARGWAAFITADGVLDAQAVPAPVPTLAAWSNGPCVAPYVRVWKQSRPVVVVVADARKADLYRYCAGELDHNETVRAHRAAGSASHMGTATRPRFHTGTRGSTGHDALQRTMLRGRDRMVDEAVERVHDLAGADGWIGVGGIKRVVARLAAPLRDKAPDRVLSPNGRAHMNSARWARTPRAAHSSWLAFEISISRRGIVRSTRPTLSRWSAKRSSRMRPWRRCLETRSSRSTSAAESPRACDSAGCT